MLKGKAIIELTDVNTGEKTVQVEDNLMTKALETFFNQPLAAYGTQSIIVNDANNLFAYNMDNLSWATAGLVVSNKALPESPDTLEVPLSSLIGAAAKQYKTQIDDGIFGTYNEAESFIDVEHGVFNHVFDFPTSACNGTVRCLSIMHPGGVIGLPYAKYDNFKNNLDIIYRRHYFLGAEIYGKYSRLAHPCPGFGRPTDGTVKDTVEGTLIGYSGYNATTLETYHYSNLEALMRLERILAFDVTDNSMYTITWTAADKFVIRKRLSRLATLCAMTPFKLLKEYPEITVTTQTESKASCGVACFDKVTKKAYYITPSKNENTTVVPGDSIHLFETDVVTGETRHFDVPNATGESLYLNTLFYRPNTDYYYGSRRQSVIIHNGNIYISPTTEVHSSDANLINKYKWFKIPLNNPSDVIVCRPVKGFTIKPVHSGNMPRGIQLLDDRYLSIQNYTASVILNLENDTIYNDYGADSSISALTSNNILNGGLIPIVGSKYTFVSYYDVNKSEPSSSKWSTDYVNTFMRLDIPMTINNLSTPIHKTPSQTMKVTYVIREV